MKLLCALFLLGAPGAFALPRASSSASSQNGSGRPTQSSMPLLVPQSTGISRTPSALTPLSTLSSSSLLISPTSTPTATVHAVTTLSTSSEYEFPTEKVGPVATLAPVVPSDHDFTNVNHLTPSKPGSGAPMHYAQEGDEDTAGIFAIATPKWIAPSVVLDHSVFIASVEMQLGNLLITFTDAFSFGHSSGSWRLDEMIFITYTPNCGDYDLGQRCYFHATEIVFDINTLSASAIGQARPIEDIVIDINVVWGPLGYQGFDYVSPTVSAPAGPGATGSATSGNGGCGASGGSSSGGSSSGGSSSGDSPTSTAYSVMPTTTGTCVAPVDTKYGLPTACLGPDFDDTLDSGLGYFNVSQVADKSAILDVDTDDEWDPSPLTKRISSRSLNPIAFIKNTIKKIGPAVQTGIKKIEAKVQSAAQAAKKNIVKVGAAVVDAAKAVVDITGKVIKGEPITKSAEFDKLLLPRPAKECKDSEKDVKQSKNMKNACKPKDDSKAVQSPWGEDALLIKSIGKLPDTKDLLPKGGKKQTTVTQANFINFYCVKCGLSGSLKAKGNVTISITEGIKDGRVSAELGLSAGLGLGIYAQYYREDKFRNNLYDIPLSPFTLGFITVGPVLSLGTELKYNVNMTGSMLARTDLNIAKATWEYDWKKGKSTSTGFKPEFVPSLQANGSVALGVQFGLPVGLEFALTTFNGCTKCKGAVGIETMPSIKAAAQVALVATLNNDTKTAGLDAVNNCTGISTTLSVRNDVSATFKGFGFVEKHWPLFETDDYIIASYCIGNKTDGTSNGRLGLQGRSLELSADPHNELEYDFPEDLYKRDAVNTTSASDGLVDLTSYVVETVDDLGYQGTTLLPTPFDLDDSELDGYWFSTLGLQGSNGDYVLSACSDSNVYMQEKSAPNSQPWYITCSTLWAGYEDTVLSTPTGGILHYYKNTMSKVNVSRLRTADESSIPGTSAYVSLAPYYYTDNSGSSEDTGPSILAAFDGDENIFFPAVCTYKDTSPARIFLIGPDVEANLAMLQSPDIEYSITNGEVDTCYLLFLSITSREAGAWTAEDVKATETYDSDPLDVEFDDNLFSADGDFNLPAGDMLSEEGDTSLDDLNAVFSDGEFALDGETVAEWSDTQDWSNVDASLTDPDVVEETYDFQDEYNDGDEGGAGEEGYATEDGGNAARDRP